MGKTAATEQLKAAILGSKPGKAPASVAPTSDLTKLYATNFALPTSNAVTQGTGYNDAVLVANAKAAAEAARQKKLTMLKEKEQAILDRTDPNKYQQVPKEDGGYTFLDPSGKQISAFDYARVTGKAPDAVLSQSQNPIDIGFVQDYQNLQNYLNAKANSNHNPEAKQLASDIEAKVKEAHGVDLGKMSMEAVQKRFHQQYPTVFGLKKAGIQSGQVYIPSAQGYTDNLGASGGFAPGSSTGIQ
jgi:hypothetical protein